MANAARTANAAQAANAPQAANAAQTAGIGNGKCSPNGRYKRLVSYTGQKSSRERTFFWKLMLVGLRPGPNHTDI